MADDDLTGRRRAYAVVVAAATVAGILFAVNAHDRTQEGAHARDAVTTISTTAPTADRVTNTTNPTTTTPSVAPDDPGALPQTDVRPAAAGPTFAAGVDALWQAIVQDDPVAGAPFFFPRSAYLQVKAIADPATDYQQRLVAAFAEDVHTLHQQLGSDAGRAVLVGADVPDDRAVWVMPGEESNTLPYWRVYGSTLRYSVDGTTRSFPITSLISWRGEWYVVHLGAIR